MAKGRIQLQSVVAGPAGLGKVLQHFARDPRGIVTAFDDTAIPTIKTLLGEDAYVDVQLFGEVVRSALTLANENPLPIYNAGFVEAAIASSCQDLPHESPFHRTKNHLGMHVAIAESLSMLGEWGLDSSALEDLVPRLSPWLASKIWSLSAIERDVRDVLRSLGREGLADHLMYFDDHLIAQLEGDFDRILIVLSPDVTPARINFIRWLELQGCDVTLVGESHPSNRHMFAHIDQIAESLGVTANRTGAPSDLQARLFGEPEAGGAKVEVGLQFTADPLAEAEWALRQAAEYHSAIFVRNIDMYAPLIEAASRRLGIPIRMSRRVPLLTNAFARVTMSAIEFCASNDVRSLLSLLPSSYLKLTGLQQELLRSGLKDARRTRDAQWTTLTDFAALHKDVFPWLGQLLAWRERATSENRTIRQWHEMFSELLRPEENLPWSQNVAEGDIAMLNRDVYARNRMQRVIAQHVSIKLMREEREISFREFVAWLKALFIQAEVTIPAGPTGVLVTSSSTSLVGFDRIFVLGMIEGVFPRRRSENAILTDAELAELSKLLSDRISFPDSHVRAAQERDEFYRVCSAAQKSLVLSYPLTSGDRDNIPAFYLKEVQSVMGLADPNEIVRTQLVPDVPSLAADIRFAEALQAPPLPMPTGEISTPEAGMRISRDPREGVTIGELKDAYRCPFMYVSRHRLQLRPRRFGERWGSLRRLPVDAMLAMPSSQEETLRRLRGALDAQIEQLYSEVPGWELRLLESGGSRIVREWVDREFRAQELWPKEPNSILLNVGFGTHHLRDEITPEVKLVGVVPATSRFGPYLVSHIYGTMPTEASKIGEIEILELGAYMLAQYQKGQESAIEVDGTGSTRTLFILSRVGNVVSDSNKMKIVNLGQDDDSVRAKRQFFDSAKKLIGAAGRIIAQGTIEARPSDYCETCDFGELCRRSRQFGEDDSPFGADLEGDDAGS